VEDLRKRLGGTHVTARETVARYYDAWQNRNGDLSDVPLAEDFEFRGPVASFDSAEGFRAMAREAGQAVTSFKVRRQFVEGDTVCSIIDWEMAIAGVGPMTSCELLEVQDGVIARGELIYDAEELRRAMAQSDATA
jgi:ketosteroid isomerase-like protein